VTNIAQPAPAPIDGVTLRRTLGINGTRFSAVLDGEAIAYIEVETLERNERQPRGGGWADIGNLQVDAAYRRQGVATWLLAHAVEWLRLAHVDRLVGYTWPEEEAGVSFLERAGFRELTRTERGWTREPE